VAFSADGAHILTTSGGGAARLWDVGTRTEVAIHHSAAIHVAEISPDGARVITASDDNTARFWDAATGESIGQPMRHGSEIKSIVFSSDGTRVVTGSGDHTARIWDAATCEPIGQPMHHGGPVCFVAFNRDSQRLLTGSYDETRLWEPPRVPVPRQKLAWFELFLGKRLDGSQQLVELTDDEIAARWKALNEDSEWIEAMHEFHQRRAGDGRGN
jgi:WD40 repeat protein